MKEPSTDKKSTDDPHDTVDSWLITLKEERKQNEADKQRSESSSKVSRG